MGGGFKAALRAGIKRGVVSGGLEVSSLLSKAGLMQRARGLGAIFTLHHVRPDDGQAFQPNGHLEITPEFLSAAIQALSQDGYDFISLAEIPGRLKNPSLRPFAAFTLDDGNRNNADYALPVFERHNVPFTVFITRGFAERTTSMWWETMTEVLRRENEIGFDFGAGSERLDLATGASKLSAFNRFADSVGVGDETAAVARIDALAKQHGIDPLQITADLTMDPDELRKLAAHPLASLGAHTLTHRAVARLSAEEAKAEMQQSADYVASITGKRPISIAYPYGSPQAVSERDEALARELGFAVGVTTQPGTLTTESAKRMTGLPRISLNGFYQKPRYVSALASGIPFRLGR